FVPRTNAPKQTIWRQLCATFKAWTARLDAVRNFEEPPPSSAEIMRKPLVEREHGLRVIAERIFDGKLQQPPSNSGLVSSQLVTPAPGLAA
ncbi:MAG TPA: hypothetical protein VIH67_00125, partial [Candidatus Acidoferrum sp.]